jgi:hypothetical protein
MEFILILIGVVLRFLPHPANFAPIAAIGLFSGCYLMKRYAFVLPLAAMLISDIFIGFYSWKIMLSVYLSFALVGLIGVWLKSHKSVYMIAGGALLSSASFFLITNFAVWAFGTLYPHSLNGLLACYIAAIPFFKNTIMGDMFYVGVLFGSYEMVHFWMGKRAKQSVIAVGS